jgi:CBS domain-containing protein
VSSRAASRLETLGYSTVYRYFAGKVDWLANGLPSEGRIANEPRIGALADASVPTCGLSERVADVRLKLEQQGWDMCAVVDERRVILGDLRARSLESGSADSTVDEVMNAGPSTYRPNVSVKEMREHLARTGGRRVYVADADGRLIGLLRREALE